MYTAYITMYKMYTTASTFYACPSLMDKANGRQPGHTRPMCQNPAAEHHKSDVTQARTRRISQMELARGHLLSSLKVCQSRCLLPGCPTQNPWTDADERSPEVVSGHGALRQPLAHGVP